MIDTADLAHRLETRLHALDAMRVSERQVWGNRQEPGALTPAAVLAPIVRRPEGWTLLLTQRTDAMPTHAGQVAFPGGRVQAEDADVIDTALRECQEETGVARTMVTPIGGLDPLETGTGYRIAPIVGYVDASFEARPDPREVAAIFETPLEFLFNPANHHARQVEWRGKTHTIYEMPFEGRRIWGATANMIRGMYKRLYE